MYAPNLSHLFKLWISATFEILKNTLPPQRFDINSMKDLFRYVLVMQMNTHIFYFYSPHALEDDVFTIWLPL